MKALLGWLLIPPLRILMRVTDPLTRLGAFVTLSARIGRRIDPSIVILGPPEVHGTARISLGRNLYLYREIYLETNDCGEIILGDDVVISRGTHIVSRQRIEIGKGTIIGEYCSLRDANHHHDSALPRRHSGHEAAPILIGNDVWIGRGCAVLAGVTIGDRAVIGANSVVTRDIPPGAVASGAPARPHQPPEAA
jgi:acetyltransferase-like isoleucine patch superfamily enzyme